MRKFSDKICRENQNTYFMFNNFMENRAFCEIMWKNIVEPDRPQMTWYGACVLHVGYLRLHARTHTHTICNTDCSPTTTTDARTRPNVTLYVHCLSCLTLIPSTVYFKDFFFSMNPDASAAFVNCRFRPGESEVWSPATETDSSHIQNLQARFGFQPPVL